jgi:hypothetical protein
MDLEMSVSELEVVNGWLARRDEVLPGG